MKSTILKTKIALQRVPLLVKSGVRNFLEFSFKNVGKAKVPSYKESSDRWSLLTRDGDGPRGIFNVPIYILGVRFNGVMETEFVVHIPCSIYESPKSSLLMQYGHGLLGFFCWR